MVPCSFTEADTVLDKPDEMSREECEALSVCRGTTESGFPVLVSCWKLTKEELEYVIRTGRIWMVVAGETMSPVWLSAIKPGIK